jgi:SpoVK/Ycf46/Vps4 family AAA+-type ATPase
MPKPPQTKQAKKETTPIVVHHKSYRERLRELDVAGYGIILTRTREPHRVIEELKEYAFSRQDGVTGELSTRFRVWDCYRGWVEYPVEVEQQEGHLQIVQKPPVVVANEVDVARAVSLIQDVDGFGRNAWGMTDGAAKWSAVAVLNYPHFQIKDNAEFITIIKGYCHSLPSGKNRLVMIVPEGFNMPPELEDDITVLDFCVPAHKELIDRFHSLCEELEIESHPFSDEDISSIAAAGLGMTQLDFDQSVSLAITEHAIDGNFTKITATIDQFIKVIYRAKVEAVKRTNMLELVDTIPLAEVGGMANLKAWADEKRDDFTQQAIEFGVCPPKGMLVVGVPGVGKSLLPTGLASFFGIPCVRWDISKVFGKYVGESEQRTDMVLSFLRSICPVLVWVDEIEKAGLSADSANDSSLRVLNKLLTFMQNAPHGLFWLFTANRPDKLPPELIRPGRVDVMFGMGYPDEQERLEIFKIHLRKRKQPITVELSAAVKVSEGYSGAEIEKAVNSAVSYAFRHRSQVTSEMLVNQIKFIKPQSVSHKTNIEAILKWCGENTIPASAKEAKSENRSVAPVMAKKAIRRIG